MENNDDDAVVFPVLPDPQNKSLVIDSAGRPIAMVTNTKDTELVVTVMNAGIIVLDSVGSDVRAIIRALETALDQSEAALEDRGVN